MCGEHHRYFIIHKPYDMVSQFVSPHNVKLLGHLDYNFPEGTHAIGRLDKNSEGLLILTTNKKVTAKLFQSIIPHKRTYFVQVKNSISEEALNKLRTGVSIRVKGGSFYTTAPCDASIAVKVDLSKISLQGDENMPGTWFSVTLTEGKYHQVRKMIAAVHHRCKRLIRVAIDEMELGDLPPGGIKEIEEKDFYSQLKIEYSEL